MFDEYIMVDWSASTEHHNANSNSIWIARALQGGDIACLNPPNRQAAYQITLNYLLAGVTAGRRVLFGVDFAYGYPRGLSNALGLNGQQPPWQLVWEHISGLAGVLAQTDAHNALDTFSIANAMNPAIAAPAIGPFWGRSDWTRQNYIMRQLPETVTVQAKPPTFR